jgi:hypothetical protein
MRLDMNFVKLLVLYRYLVTRDLADLLDLIGHLASTWDAATSSPCEAAPW